MRSARERNVSLGFALPQTALGFQDELPLEEDGLLGLEEDISLGLESNATPPVDVFYPPRRAFIHIYYILPVSLNGSKGLYGPVMSYYFGTKRNLAGYLYIAALAI